MEPARHGTLQELNFETGSESKYFAKYRQHRQREIVGTPWFLTLSVTVCVTIGLLTTFSISRAFPTAFEQTRLNPIIQMSMFISTQSVSNASTPLLQSANIAHDGILDIDILTSTSTAIQESAGQRLSFLTDEIEATQFAIQLMSASQTALAEAQLGQLQAKLERLHQEYTQLENLRFSRPSSIQMIRDNSTSPLE